MRNRASNEVGFICRVNFRLMLDSHEFKMFQMGLITGEAIFTQW